MSSSIARRIVWTFTTVVVPGPVAAQQTVELPTRDRVLRERPAAVFTVGVVEGEESEMFSGIRSIAFDTADNMYVLDGQNTRVVVFDSKGSFVRQFGKKGGGPGELQAPLGMDIAADGTVVISDIANRGFVVFRPDGEYVRNVTFDEDIGFPIAVEADASGDMIGRSIARPRPDRGTSDAGVSPIFRQSLETEEVHTIYRVPVTPPRVTQTGGGNRVASISMEPIFGPRPSFGVLPTGFAIHHDTEYAIRILDDAGRHVRTLSRDFEPRRVTEKDQETWREQRSQEMASGGGPTVIMARRSPAGASTSVGGSNPMTFDVGPVPFADYMAVVTSIRTDPQGRIWVQRRNEDGKAEGPIDLVTADGRYIGTLPRQPMPLAVSASGFAAWVVTDDELGVERVVVRRLPATWR
ncbi:MAG TPA: 6-bladed beta-propeller [Longimicrobiales bacterium]|nr:6-bladed beta-propeller [Longimicrobiales bacterium]